MAIYPTGAGLSIALRATNSVKSLPAWSRGVPGNTIYLWVADNGRYTPGDDIEAEPGYFLVHGLTRRQVLGGDYDGIPQLTLRIHLVMNAHGAEACADGTLLVTTTEAVGETAPPEGVPGDQDYHESVLVIDADKIQPSITPRVIDLTTDDFVRVRCGELGGDVAFGRVITHFGMRDVKQLHDGSILLARGPVFTRMPLEQLRNKTDLASAPVRYTTGAQGEFAGYGLIVDPENPEHVWSLGAAPPLPASLWQFALTNPPGVSTLDRLGRGSNYDPDNWGGSHRAFDAEGNLWMPRSGVPDIACFERAQLNTLNGGNPQINLTPARTITSAAISAINYAREYMWGFAIRDGRMFVCTYDFGALPRPAARILIFDLAALAGGEHEPISVVSGLPTRAVQLTFAPSV